MSSFDKFEETLTTLNDVQRQAVLSEAESLQIMAGPGSGKTRVLTLRVAQQVIGRNIDPRNILVVTFTKKAANEMRERLDVLIGPKLTKQLVMGTFHSVCSQLLRRYGGYVGLKTTFVIIDNSESKEIVSDIVKELRPKLKSYVKDWKIGPIWKYITDAKNDELSPVDYAQIADTPVKQEIAQIYTRYEEELDKNNLVDFDNLLLKACQLLRLKRNAWSHIQAVLVDEYQDTNLLQYNLIELLVHQKVTKTLTIVGDPDQSIFGWRNAEPANFGKMRNDFEGTEIINMEQNYRSSSTILKSALHVIVQDKNRFDKTLYTNNAEGVPISFIDTPNEETQAEFVASEIKRVIKYSKGLITHKDIAVLMRMNYISQKFEYTFRKHRIPYTVAKGDRFFGRIEVQDIIAYLRLAHNPGDGSSFKRVINVPKRGVGDANLKKIIDYKEQKKINFLQALNHIAVKNQVSNVSALVRKRLTDFHNVIDETRNRLEETTDLSEVIQWIINAIGYEKYLKENGNTKKTFEERWANVGELVSIAKKFSSIEPEEDVDSSFYVSSQEPNKQKQQQQHPVYEEDEDEDDIFEVKEESDEDVVDFTAQSTKNNDTQGYDSQDVIYTQTQKSESEDILDEAFQEDFDADDEPVYQAPKTALQDFLEYCSLSSDERELEAAEEGKVTIATMHASKGLEWPCVFVVTCNETVIPMNNADDHQEEGRVLYVAMTRSKFLLYCVAPDRLEKFGRNYNEPRSFFLDNMDNKLYVRKVPDWNNSIRRVLAKILGKPAPPDDDSLCTTAKEFDEDGEEIKSMDIRFSNGEAVNLDQFGGFTTALTLSNKRDNGGFKVPKKQKRIKYEEE